ncbi:hypothetical protein [Nonomuraea sp. GTA35]|uniref:hypothetical protein n=1 Tax=Nonomuraea sp. GTA35 TaxID=1676746 RepID=UPI0035BEC196
MRTPAWEGGVAFREGGLRPGRDGDAGAESLADRGDTGRVDGQVGDRAGSMDEAAAADGQGCRLLAGYAA